MATVQELLRSGVERLRASGSETPRLDAELLLAHAINADRTVVVAYPESVVSDGAAERYEALFGSLPSFLSNGHIQPGCTGLDAKREGIDCHGKPGDGAEYDSLSATDRAQVTRVMVNAGKAIAAYVRQLRCGRMSFDDFMQRDEGALTPAEIRGALLFAGKARCSSCHSARRSSCVAPSSR